MTAPAARPAWAPDLDRRVADAQRTWRAPSAVAAVVREGYACTRDVRTFEELGSTQS